MKISRRVLMVFAGLIAVIVAAGFVLPFFESTREQSAQSQIIATSLTGARSVTLVEFVPYTFDENTASIVREERVIQVIAATSEQVRALRAATATATMFRFTQTISGCYIPHHRVEVVRQNGSFFDFEVCLSCRKFRFDRGPEQTIPDEWLPRLREFFRDAGMPLRTDAGYAAFIQR